MTRLVSSADAGGRVGGVPAAIGETLELGGAHKGELAPAAAVVRRHGAEPANKSRIISIVQLPSQIKDEFEFGYC